MPSRETIADPLPQEVSGAQENLRKLKQLERALGTVVRGKPEVVRLSLACLIARGHLLIEDVPGVGKTTLAHALARSAGSRFHRLQFTSDMLPSDVVGVTIYNSHLGAFEFKQGPIFTNFLLADEINRTTPKTQSALLEAMNEQQVTMDGHSYQLPKPFMVIATQNPVDHHGTYPLPESQLDRFLMRLRIGYPDAASEREILRQTGPVHGNAEAIMTAGEIEELQAAAPLVAVDEALAGYMLAIVEKTRTHEALSLGVSPRGAQALFRASQALAMLEARDYVIPDDVKRLAAPVFGHRIVVRSRTAAGQRQGSPAVSGDRIIGEILQLVEVPL